MIKRTGIAISLVLLAFSTVAAYVRDDLEFMDNSGKNVKSQMKDEPSKDSSLRNTFDIIPKKTLYDTGLDKFKIGRYDEAIQDFKAYISQNPEPVLVGNAYFYIGESLYAERKYDDAILIYDTIVKKIKKSDKVPDALYKQGLAFFKMGDKDTGTLILDLLIKDHPRSDAAQKAKITLKNPPEKELMVVNNFKDSDKDPKAEALYDPDAEALYQKGLSFLKMGHIDNGTLTLMKLIRGYPKTDAAKKAKKALKNPPGKER